MTRLDRQNREVVLIVDDVPENLSMLHDALDEAGYAVLVATSGDSALARARQSLPDVILLDAVMPGMDGFEVARRLKADFSTRHIPIVFMTGLTETEHIVAAFAAGSADYVTKPLKPAEVLARIAAHVQSARQIQQARSALDASGQATLAVRSDQRRLVWQTDLARHLLAEYFGGIGDEAPARLLEWLAEAEQAQAAGREAPTLLATSPDGRLLASFKEQGATDERVIVLREESEAQSLDVLAASFRLTQREAEVLHWVIKGKTNRDIAEILGMSPRTVNKHLEHVFEKLGVETRTAATSLALSRLRG